MDKKAQIELLNCMVKKALEGNYHTSNGALKVDDDFLELYENIQAMIQMQKNYGFEMSASASQIISVSEDLSITLEENNKFTDDLYLSSKNIKNINQENHEYTVAAVQEIKEFIRYVENIKNWSQKANDIGGQTKYVIEAGLNQVYKMIDYIKEIESTTNKSMEQFGDFMSSVVKIFHISRTVENLSKQMELLSFNATIEARKAGTEGKSFMVIAQAFRELSERSKGEVIEIFDLIHNIQENSNQLMKMVDINSSNVTQCVEHSNGIASGLSHIETKYQDVIFTIEEINKASEIQAKIANQINNHITRIERNSGKFNDNFNTINVAIKKQRSDMKELSKLGQHLYKASDSLFDLIKNCKDDNSGDQQEKINKIAQTVFDLFDREILSVKALVNMQAADHHSILDQLLTHDMIESVWTNAANGKFIYSNPPAGISNARIREWFQESIKGKKYISQVYISAITKKPCITVSMPIFGEDNCIGVLGADLKLT